MNPELKVGDKVIVTRRIGKDGAPHYAKGVIEMFSKTILIHGEPTAYIKYDDGGGYYHKISSIQKSEEVLN